MAATVEEGAESWYVDEGDCVIAECYSRERAERVATALNEHDALCAQVARARALAERLQGGWHGACHFGPDWTAGKIVREVGREFLAALDGEGGAL